jgi:hypothetical protein
VEFQKVAAGEKVPLRGGQKFAADPLGALYSKNLTPDPETVAALRTGQRILWQYTSATGEVTDEANPNGSVENIAGICNERRNVAGLMPHPGRACDPLLGSADGRLLLSPRLEDRYATHGVVATIEQIGRLPGGRPGAVLRAEARARIGVGVTGPGAALWVEAELIENEVPSDRAVELAAEYKALAKRYGIVSTGIVEASPLFADNQAVLDMVKGDRFFSFLVAQMEIGSPDFPANLDRLAQDPRVVGIRAAIANIDSKLIVNDLTTMTTPIDDTIASERTIAMLAAVFGSLATNPAGGQGLIHGSAAFFGKQVAAGVGCSLYAFAFTYVMLRVLDWVTPVRVGEDAESGLDEAMHGEVAYA